MGVARDGLVQAVKVLSTEQSVTTVERRAYRKALKVLAGQDLGRKVRSWRRFWSENSARLLRERAERHEQESSTGK